MKRNITLYLPIFALISFLTLGSCDRFLDSVPKDFLSPENYYENEEQINFALNGVYDVLGNRSMYGDVLISRMGTEADEGFYAVSTFRGPQVYDFSSSDPYVTNLWKILYDGINRANMVIGYIDKPELSSENRANILGQAKFLRAYYYFLLVSNWGSVPLITNISLPAENFNARQKSIDEIYAFITKELEEAEKLLPDAKTVGFGGRVTKSAAQGILARVYLHMAGHPLNDKTKYQDVLTWSSKLIDGGFHRLNSSYEDIFIKYARDEYDIQESIWEVEFWGNTAGPYREGGRVGVNTGISTTNTTIGNTYGFIQVTARLYNSYAEGDLRRDWAIAPWRYQNVGGVPQETNWQPWPTHTLYQRHVGKWRRKYELVTPKSTNDSPQNFPLLRFSDVLLMYAEAANELNSGPTSKAYEAINRVRRRGYGFDEFTANPLSDLTGLDYTSFFDELKKERSRELCFEALRKNDLIRWGVLQSTMTTIADDFQNGTDIFSSLRYGGLAASNVEEPKHLLLPIPAYEIGLKPYLQPNPGW
ncbi:starch-binding protein [Sphingobacterium alkalisoli]|nr:RagB/SusD family nutrient uptake outer membrane protein [Sphingobacterium alkalisoli]GGH20197.1 starch-binding protein [Sphingobacterium alkalisoli]